MNPVLMCQTTDVEYNIFQGAKAFVSPQRNFHWTHTVMLTHVKEHSMAGEIWTTGPKILLFNLIKNSFLCNIFLQLQAKHSQLHLQSLQFKYL